VRTPPMCSKPVGLGAKRVTTAHLELNPAERAMSTAGREC